MTRKKILIMDDDVVTLTALSQSLSGEGYDVLVSEDGAGGVSMARQHKPDLILLDLNFVPEAVIGSIPWDGFLLLGWLRRMEEAQDIPVIFISADDSEPLRHRAQQAGALDFFSKPIDHECLLAIVHQTVFGAAGMAIPEPEEHLANA
jgi:CheY-like chemotaxis protein